MLPTTREIFVSFKGFSTVLDISQCKSISQVQDLIKSKYSNLLANFDAPQIKLVDDKGLRILSLEELTQLDPDFSIENHRYLEIKIQPYPTQNSASDEGGVKDGAISSKFHFQ